MRLSSNAVYSDWPGLSRNLDRGFPRISEFFYSKILKTEFRTLYKACALLLSLDPPSKKGPEDGSCLLFIVNAGEEQ